MKNKIEVKKIKRTDKDVDNSCFEMKVPYEVTDDFGNTVEMFRKETIDIKVIDEQIERLQKELEDLLEKKEMINKLEVMHNKQRDQLIV